jgi:hypothetical protein
MLHFAQALCGVSFSVRMAYGGQVSCSSGQRHHRPGTKVTHAAILVAVIFLMGPKTPCIVGGAPIPTLHNLRLNMRGALLASEPVVEAGGKAFLCAHGRFGPKCEFECHESEGGFCTDEGIVCFVGKEPALLFL